MSKTSSGSSMWTSGPCAAEVALPRANRRSESDAPQFSIRLLLIMISTCAIAFAILGAQVHGYLNAAAVMVLVFWLGISLSFVGLALDRFGDTWFALAALAGAIGSGTIVIAMFTGAYYGLLFLLALFAAAVY